jgi:UDP-glucose 4-epimerase
VTQSINTSALVWGARGFIGHSLVDDLVGRGWKVRILSRSAAPRRPAWAGAIEWVELDPKDREGSCLRAVDGVSVIFNLAGSSGAVDSNRQPLESLESNCRLQLEFLGACARAGHKPHVVFASSRLVYAHAGSDPIAEDHPVAPASMYAAHKLCIEHYHRIYAQHGRLSFTVCRISNPFGLDQSAPEKGYGFINALIQRALAGERLTLFGTGRQLRDYVYIADLVTMLRLCAERAEVRNEILNIGFGRSLSMYDAAAHIVGCFGGSIDFRPWPQEYEAVESGDFVLDTTKAQALLRFVPVYSFTDGLADVRLRAATTAGAMAQSRHASPVPAAFGTAVSQG